MPLIQAFIAAEYSTIGFDVDQQKVDRLLVGEIRRISSDRIADGIADSHFTPTADLERLAEADVILIFRASGDTGQRPGQPEVGELIRRHKNYAMIRQPGMALRTTPSKATSRLRPCCSY